ncbi:MAG: CoA pyrophosphatase [Actinobacteria bacterium]|nr:MAG: CoA pyrophosphatase [Actinomycetota bacterium]
MLARGGKQRIPRPEGVRPGDAAPWSGLSPDERRFSLADVRAACSTLAAPSGTSGLEVAGTTLPAAVLVPIFEEDGEARLILTKRPETMPTHQGQIAFPGGKLDPVHDPDLCAAALREAYEEIGLSPSSVEIVAELDSIVTVSQLFTVTPFVGLIDRRPALSPHATEVVAVFDVAISELLHPDTFREERWDGPSFREGQVQTPGLDRAVHFYELPGETMWGATARILTRFLVHLVAQRLR